MAEVILAAILCVGMVCLTFLVLGAAAGEFKWGQYGSGALLLVVAGILGLFAGIFCVGAVQEYEEYRKERLDPNYHKEKVHRLACMIGDEVSFVSQYGDGRRGRDNTVYTLPDGKVYVVRPGESCGWQFSYR